VTAFVVSSAGTLTFGSKAASGGAFPVSATVHDHLVYVVNQLGIANIAGFRVDDSGHLQAIAGSSRALSGRALAQPAEVSFTPDGSHLLVTEKGTDLIDVFAVNGDGTTSGPIPKKSVAHTPFGFTFGPGESVIVSNAERRLPLQATTSSYLLSGDNLTTVSARVPDKDTGACWIAVTGETAWVVNTFTANIAAYHVDEAGELTLMDSMAAATGDDTTPIDVATTPDGQFLYVLKSATGSIAAFSINGNNLTFLFEKSGLPLSIQGLVAR
jgi:6-phosphogluconolactonase (cycloisomerase 2 family)